MVALQQVTVDVDEVLLLVGGLYSFGDDLQIEALGNAKDGVDQAGAAGVSGGARDRGLVDLDEVDGEVDEPGQRGVASAEVVDGQRVTVLPVARQPGGEFGAGEVIFGDF